MKFGFSVNKNYNLPTRLGNNKSALAVQTSFLTPIHSGDSKPYKGLLKLKEVIKTLDLLDENREQELNEISKMIVHVAAIDPVQFSSKSELSSRFCGRLKIRWVGREFGQIVKILAKS